MWDYEINLNDWTKNEEDYIMDYLKVYSIPFDDDGNVLIAHCDSQTQYYELDNFLKKMAI